MSVAQTMAEPEAGQEGNSPEAQAQVQQEGRLSAEQMHSLSLQAEGKEAKQKRTPGLKFVDGAVYAGVTHFGVFAISVVFTYLTRHGNAIGGKFPNWMQNRSNKVINFMTSKGMKEQAAKDFTVVGFSFLDGCLLLPLVRALESQRTRIAYAVDKVMGKVPKKTLPDGKVVDDMSIYEKEPPQGWASVIAGRVAAAGMVVPVAMALDKWTPSKNKVKEDGTPKNFNDIVMRDFGYKIAEKIENKALGKWIIGKSDTFFAKRHERLPEGETAAGQSLKPKEPYKIKLPEFMEVNVFETVWTAICTAVLYVTSRSVASFMGKRKEKKAEAEHVQPQAGGEKPAEQSQSRMHEEKAAQPAGDREKADSQPMHASGKQTSPKSAHGTDAVAKGDEKAWADFVKQNPELAEKLTKTVESQLARVQQRDAERTLAGAGRA